MKAKLKFAARYFLLINLAALGGASFIAAFLFLLDTNHPIVATEICVLAWCAVATFLRDQGR